MKRYRHLMYVALSLSLACASQRSDSYKANEMSEPGAVIDSLAVDGVPMEDAFAPSMGVKSEDKAEEEPENAPVPEPEAKDGKKKSKKGKSTTWKRSSIEANTSTIMVGDREELPIKGAQIFAKADGFRARVLIDFYFVNDRDTQLQGTFRARLPDGATPYMIAFGGSKVALGDQVDAAALEEAGIYLKPEEARGVSMDAEGALAARQASWIDAREGRMVPRVKARRAFDQRVNQRIDPALMEWSGPSVFTAKLFPLEPKKVHKVVLGYEMDLERVGDDLQLDIPLPKGVSATAVDLEVASVASALELSDGASTFESSGRTYVSWRGEREGMVRARIGAKGASTIGGRDPALGGVFASRVTPELPVMAAKGSSSAVFLVDTSMSSNPDAYNVYLALLAKTLEANRGNLKRFAVAFFDVETRWWREEFVENSPENVEAMMRAATSQALEGATDLGAALREVATRGFGADDAADVFLLSDGAATWGESDRWVLSTLAKSEGVGALFAYRTGMRGASTATLGHLARELGGAVFSVTGEDQLEGAARAHTKRPWRLIEVRGEGMSDVLVAGRPQALYPGQRVKVVGRGALGKNAKVTFVVEQSGERREIEASLGAWVESDLASRTYGEVAVAQLEELVRATESESSAYARHFRVVGKTTSLLMLETDEEYAEFEIDEEADARKVSETKVRHLVLHALDALTARLGDARASLLDELARLRTTPGVDLELSEELVGLLKETKSSALAMPPAPLRTKGVKASSLPEAWSKQLSERKPEYDAGYAEATRRLKTKGAADALKALSSLVEARPGDAVLARDVAFTAMEWGLDGQAAYLLRRVAEQRPDEPQTYHALARALESAGAPALALAYYEVGLSGKWDPRFGEFRAILAQDYLRFLREQGSSLPPALSEWSQGRLGQIREIVGIDEADLVVTVMWNTDRTDVDLHVIEPSGEECYYSHPKTRSGGRLTQDVTQGYGPEMYVLEKAPRGNYKVRAKYFASDRSRLTTRTKVYATITRAWGTPRERVERMVVSLEDGQEMHDILNVSVK